MRRGLLHQHLYSKQSDATIQLRKTVGPAPRANPYPEVTDLFCRLPLPTLTCWPEAAHLGDLMRFTVRPSERLHIFLISSDSDFQGPSKAHWTLQKVREFVAGRSASSPVDPFPRPFELFSTVKKGREPFPVPSPVSRSQCALPHMLFFFFKPHKKKITSLLFFALVWECKPSSLSTQGTFAFSFFFYEK
jgi:hypothetical protein